MDEIVILELPAPSIFVYRVGSMWNQGGHRRAVGAVAAVKVARMPPTVT